ncbi:hypothetical protein H6G20_04880 [Desertifilum sp. FACHB-1129]|uniref:Uncharacterized protein n=1 Tax=Desertifilum tharense IPPAS B-1220 TaxID=1781255 RepID=A0A1E5QMX3_9CYAN|nr:MULTISPECIES: hypothetical protein [unclassified Desertifilum]MDA0208819.1 hypothetical protein [Cyanobacteria bacterium FC1]OEJ75961.1 hypothetical protein BH720_06695 [Desertifilum tharense IPPAS B-1220]MBD2311020.1 hypothetical protein [Desertifilum sp. FACHB-1129]MBD2321425.1 hypothetical protein [Desertifilum sp. FACHB-866]MBD2331268.1 hypothetical protein [Desertifilum sp. FACHB-868]
MSHDQIPGNTRLPAPCIINTGAIVNKRDMQRLLADLGRVRYFHLEDGQLQSEGEGYVREVFADPQQATIVANQTLYLNVYSFDYIELRQSSEQATYLDLVQDTRLLRLMPLSNPLQEQTHRNLNVAALEAMLADVLAAGWDVQIDDEENFSL